MKYQKTHNSQQKTSDREQKTGGSRQRTENRWQRTENRKQKKLVFTPQVSNLSTLISHLSHLYTNWCLLFAIKLFFTFSLIDAAEMRVYYISVGRGDAQYIELPNGENVLIDGGPDSRNSISNPLISFLERKGINEIHHVILSHPHSDHYNGLSAVFDRYKIRNYYDSFLSGSSAAEIFRQKAISESGVQVKNTTQINLATGSTFYSIINSTPPIYFVMNHRGDAFGTNPPSANDVSIIFTIIFGSSSFIFGGDAGYGGSYRPLEQAVVGLISPPNPDGIKIINHTVDCYKVNHHGSSSSSESGFLSVLKPMYAFIGTDGTSYGHPTTAAMDRINFWTSQASDKFVQEIKGINYTNIYATYLNGHIMVETAGDGRYQIQRDYVPAPVVISTVTGNITDLPPLTARNLGYINIANNLFNPDRQESLVINYVLNNDGDSIFKVYSICGEQVYSEKIANISKDTQRTWSWDGRNYKGEIVASGAYFVFVQTPDGKEVKKAVVMR